MEHVRLERDLAGRACVSGSLRVQRALCLHGHRRDTQQLQRGASTPGRIGARRVDGDRARRVGTSVSTGTGQLLDAAEEVVDTADVLWYSAPVVDLGDFDGMLTCSRVLSAVVE